MSSSGIFVAPGSTACLVDSAVLAVSKPATSRLRFNDLGDDCISKDVVRVVLGVGVGKDDTGGVGSIAAMVLDDDFLDCSPINGHALFSSGRSSELSMRTSGIGR